MAHLYVRPKSYSGRYYFLQKFLTFILVGSKLPASPRTSPSSKARAPICPRQGASNVISKPNFKAWFQNEEDNMRNVGIRFLFTAAGIVVLATVGLAMGRRSGTGGARRSRGPDRVPGSAPEVHRGPRRVP